MDVSQKFWIFRCGCDFFLWNRRGCPLLIILKLEKVQNKEKRRKETKTDY
jgi:hypothetical protein